jgi:putative ABC transport system permease protein
MSEALTNFAYSISISWFYFLESIAAALVVALLTITFHAVKAANSNPVDSLRYE